MERAKIGEDPLKVVKIFHSSFDLINMNRNALLQRKWMEISMF
jgi:hypothetical protein